MLRTRLVIFGICLFVAGVTTIVYANNRSEFQNWLKQETQSFTEYRDKRDKEFTSFLKSQWKEMQTFQGMVRDKTPKPREMPVAPPPVIKPVPEPVVKPEIVPAQPEPEPAGKPIQKPIAEKKPEPAVKQPVKVLPVKPVPIPEVIRPTPVVELPRGDRLDVEFYGHNLRFSYDPRFKVKLAQRINAKAMSDHWSALSQADYESLIDQVNLQKQPLQLNDWGYVLLINRVAQGIYRGQQNEQALFTWFMLTKAGYNARIAYEAHRVYLLIPSRQQLFAAPYFTFDKLRFYALGFDGKKQKPGRVFTYDGHYPGATRRLDMSLSSSIHTNRDEKLKTLSFKYDNKTYRIRVGYDDQTVAFLKTYPQMDIGMYFVADVNRATANPLLQQLKPLVEGRSEQDAVNLLLRFVQTAFQYKTDEGQFGVENYLFPEETLHYPYSDCEDRSVFFAWLVHNLLGLEVVGLDFPGHIATAVHFNESVRGDAIRFNNKRYVVADPTYINASAGMTMPDYKNKQPGVIRIIN